MRDRERSMSEPQIIKYTCPKCGSKEYKVGEMWTISSFWAKIFEFYSRRFTYISCERCHFTELYKVPKKMIGEAYSNFVR